MWKAILDEGNIGHTHFFYSLILLSTISFLLADGSFVVQPPFNRATSRSGAFT